MQCFLVLCLEWLYRKCSSLEKNQDFLSVATWRVRGEQASSARGQQGKLGWPVLCYRCFWSLKFRLPQKQEFWGVPPKQDMQVSVIYVQSDNLSHRAFLISIIKVLFVLKKRNPLSNAIPGN